MENATTSESIATSQAPTETPAAAPVIETKPEAQAAPAASAPVADAVVPAYTPNYKFKVKDKEMDFDEFLKPVVKDKATEDKIKELYEKAHGIEEVKAHRQSIQEKLKEAEGKYTSIDDSLKTLGNYVQKKDFRTFFDILQIPRQDIINYALEELKFQELPAEQKAIIESQRQREFEYESQQGQTQVLQQQMQDMVLKQTTWELNQELSKPDIAQVIQAYDARVGKPGALRGEIIRRGQYYEAVHKTSPPAGQLVAEVLSLVGGQTSTPQGGSMQPNGTLGMQSQAVQNQKPVIPSFSGGGANKSPVKKVPTSIDDLRKLRQQQNL